jgi:hypothetical protein
MPPTTTSAESGSRIGVEAWPPRPDDLERGIRHLPAGWRHPIRHPHRRRTQDFESVRVAPKSLDSAAHSPGLDGSRSRATSGLHRPIFASPQRFRPEQYPAIRSPACERDPHISGAQNLVSGQQQSLDFGPSRAPDNRVCDLPAEHGSSPHYELAVSATSPQQFAGYRSRVGWSGRSELCAPRSGGRWHPLDARPVEHYGTVGRSHTCRSRTGPMCIGERDYRAACMMSKACEFAGTATRVEALQTVITECYRVGGWFASGSWVWVPLHPLVVVGITAFLQF